MFVVKWIEAFDEHKNFITISTFIYFILLAAKRFLWFGSFYSPLDVWFLEQSFFSSSTVRWQSDGKVHALLMRMHVSGMEVKMTERGDFIRYRMSDASFPSSQQFLAQRSWSNLLFDWTPNYNWILRFLFWYSNSDMRLQWRLTVACHSLKTFRRMHFTTSTVLSNISFNRFLNFECGLIVHEQGAAAKTKGKEKNSLHGAVQMWITQDNKLWFAFCCLLDSLSLSVANAQARVNRTLHTRRHSL